MVFMIQKTRVINWKLENTFVRTLPTLVSAYPTVTLPKYTHVRAYSSADSNPMEHCPQKSQQLINGYRVYTIKYPEN